MRPPGAESSSAKSIQEDEIPLAVMAGRMKKVSENTSTIPEVMDSSTLIFNPNVKFSRFFFGGGGPRPHSGSATKPWSISIVCKNFGAQHPLGRNTRVGQKVLSLT